MLHDHHSQPDMPSLSIVDLDELRAFTEGSIHRARSFSSSSSSFLDIGALEDYLCFSVSYHDSHSFSTIVNRLNGNEIMNTQIQPSHFAIWMETVIYHAVILMWTITDNDYAGNTFITTCTMVCSRINMHIKLPFSQVFAHAKRIHFL